MAQLEPDQRADRWDDHVSVYQDVFEPLSLAFGQAAIRSLNLASGARVLDIGAGAGGVALKLAAGGAEVTAIDASAGMIARLQHRAKADHLAVDARVMDGQNLTFESQAFDAALSVFGVILFPDAVRGLAEMRRVVRPGGRVSIVTWTEPQAYELAVTLRAALDQVRPPSTPGMLPAQLRFRERAACAALFREAGFADADIAVETATLIAPSARWLAERLAFAPGMEAMLTSAGNARNACLTRFVEIVEASQGAGEVRFGARAFVASANVT